MKTIIPPIALPYHATEALVILGKWKSDEKQFFNVPYPLRTSQLTAREKQIVIHLCLPFQGYIGYVGTDDSGRDNIAILRQNHTDGRPHFIIINNGYIYGQIDNVWHRFPRRKKSDKTSLLRLTFA